MMAEKEYKARMKVSMDVNVLNTIEMLKSEKNTEETGSLLKMLLLESPTFAEKYEEIMRLFGKSA